MPIDQNGFEPGMEDIADGWGSIYPNEPQPSSTPSVVNNYEPEFVLNAKHLKFIEEWGPMDPFLYSRFVHDLSELFTKRGTG